MEDIKCTGIVIKTIDYKDKDKLLSIYTLENGLITASLKGVKQAKSKLKPFGQPLCFAEWVLVKTGENLTVTNANMIDAFFELTKDYDKFCIACVMLDMVKQSSSYFENQIEMFVNLLKALRLLTYSEVNPKMVLIKFSLNILKLNGYELSGAQCDDCGVKLGGVSYFDISTGSFKCDLCKTPICVPVSAGVNTLIRNLSGVDYDKINIIKPSHNVVNETLTLIKLDVEKRISAKINFSQVF